MYFPGFPYCHFNSLLGLISSLNIHTTPCMRTEGKIEDVGVIYMALIYIPVYIYRHI